MGAQRLRPEYAFKGDSTSSREASTSSSLSALGMTSSELGHLGPVATSEHRAPAAISAAGGVEEVERASGSFALPNKLRGLAPEETHRLAGERCEQCPRSASEHYPPGALELRHRSRSRGNLIQGPESDICCPSCSASRERENRLPKGAGGE